MEGLTGVELLMVYALGFGVILAAIAVWILAWRWMWKQRGIGFAEGWYEVADKRATRPLTLDQLSEQWRQGLGTGTSAQMTAAPPKSPAAEPVKPAPAGPVRYLVPTERK